MTHAAVAERAPHPLGAGERPPVRAMSRDELHAERQPGGAAAGGLGDTDVYGAQQHAPLLDVEIPD